MIIIHENVVFLLRVTKSGGYVLSTIDNGKMIKTYTHPIRASVKRLSFDLDKLLKMKTIDAPDRTEIYIIE